MKAIAVACVVALSAAVAAETTGMVDPGTNVRVGSHAVFPLVIGEKVDGALTYSGFEHEIRDAIFDSLGWAVDYVDYETSTALRAAVASGEVDMGSGAITRTAEREASGMDFSHAFMHTDFSVLIREENAGRGLWDHVKDALRFRHLRTFGESLLSSALTEILIAVLLVIVVFGHLLYFFQQKDVDAAIPDSYIPGVIGAMWYITVMVISGEVLHRARRPFTRLLVVLSVTFGAIFVINLITINTGDYTVQELEYAMSGPEELRGRMVATKPGTTSEDLLRLLGARIRVEDQDGRPVTDIAQAYPLLENDLVDAVVYDSPALLHKSNLDPVFKVALRFGSQDLAFAFPEDSPLIESVNRTLLRMRESGDYAAIHRRWFGE